jgi:hypothetical protein
MIDLPLRRPGEASGPIHDPLTPGNPIDCSGRRLPIHKALCLAAVCRAVRRVTVDLAAFFVYLAARNMVFGFTVLTRCRLWAATQVISQNSDCCRRRDVREGVQQKA